MISSTITAFRKGEGCPSSQELLEFQTGEIPRDLSSDLRWHLESCEFCAAEVEFYSHYPQAEGTIETAEIPAPLFELAEALLKNRLAADKALNALLDEKSSLVH